MSARPFTDTTIVCVTYESLALVDTLADALRGFPHVIVVDNASTDGTAAALQAQLPYARVVVNSRNIGYGPACNQAMRQVNTPFALLLNPDCSIVPETVLTLLSTLRRYPSAGIVAPQSLDRNGKPRKSYRPAFYLRMRDATYRLPDATCSAQWVHGCCQLLRTRMFRSIGGFDEGFFLFFEDDDLCLRMQRDGFECLLEPDATIRHVGGASSASTMHNQFLRCYHYVRSKHRITRKYLGRRAARRYLLKILSAALPAMLLYTVLLRRRHVIKWLAWGVAAVSCAFDPHVLAPEPEAAGAPGHLTR